MKADKGILLCGGFATLDGKIKQLTYDDSGFGPTRRDKDRKLAVVIRNHAESFDGWITWNGLMYDLPFVDDRLTLTGENTLERRFARGLDIMWHAAMGKATFTSRRLEWVAKALGCPYKRSPLDIGLWKDAEAEVLANFSNGRENYDQVVAHNRGCLKYTLWCYNKLKPRITSISKR